MLRKALADLIDHACSEDATIALILTYLVYFSSVVAVCITVYQICKLFAKGL